MVNFLVQIFFLSWPGQMWQFLAPVRLAVKQTVDPSEDDCWDTKLKYFINSNNTIYDFFIHLLNSTSGTFSGGLSSVVVNEFIYIVQCKIWPPLIMCQYGASLTILYLVKNTSLPFNPCSDTVLVESVLWTKHSMLICRTTMPIGSDTTL